MGSGVASGIALTVGPTIADTLVANTLAARGHRYGSFKETAAVSQNLKRVMALSKNWDEMPDEMRYALDMIAVKIGRILNGDPFHKDSWHDISGYAQLVERELPSE